MWILFLCVRVRWCDDEDVALSCCFGSVFVKLLHIVIDVDVELLRLRSIWTFWCVQKVMLEAAFFRIGRILMWISDLSKLLVLLKVCACWILKMGCMEMEVGSFFYLKGKLKWICRDEAGVLFWKHNTKSFSPPFQCNQSYIYRRIWWKFWWEKRGKIG